MFSTRRWIRIAIPVLAVILAFWFWARPGKSKIVTGRAQAAAAQPASHHPFGAQPALDTNSTVQPAPASPSIPQALGRESVIQAFSTPGFMLKDTKSASHVVKHGESVASIAWHYLPETGYLTGHELEEAIRKANGLRGNNLRPGATISIPGIPVHPFSDRPVSVPRTFVVRAIYLTGWTAGSERGLELISKWKAAGGNAVVFDIKDFDGQVRVPFHHEYAPHVGVTIHNLPKFIHWLHGLHMHVIARIALFRDAYMATTYRRFDIRSRKTGKPWLENGQLDWVDPSLPAVQEYNLDLARMAADAGADEIQLDYVRFPAQGNQADAVFAFQKDHPGRLRTQIITDFVGRAYQELHSKGVLVSLDVFGVMAWARPVDLRLTGQDIPALARRCDVLSPMIYPSHFFHFDGYADPGDAPEHFISESMQRFEAATKGAGVVIRPWLQAFHWRTKSYSVSYVLTEMRVAAQQGGIGFLFWNAANKYPKPLAAMAGIHNAGPSYLAAGETAKTGSTPQPSTSPSNQPRLAPAGGATPTAPGAVANPKSKI
jgi:hypothetical protein